MVIYLTKLLKKNNYKPGIVSRGYGRHSTGLITVHDGNKLLNGLEENDLIVIGNYKAVSKELKHNMQVSTEKDDKD